MKIPMKNNYFLYILFLVTPFFSESSQYQFSFASQKQIQLDCSTPLYTEEMEQNRPWITIWVHGTRCFTRPFFKKFFDVPLGLNKALNLQNQSQGYAIAKTLNSENPSLFPLEHFYMFGWSGFLSIKARQQAAQELINALQSLINSYKDQKLNPKIRIITHSHGGNVVLHLTEQETGIPIDELVLLACPVQNQTKNYIQHHLFKQIISLYSTWDLTQVLDPQGLYSCTKNSSSTFHIFSERTFPLQSNLFQVELWYNNRGLMHIEFLLCDSFSCIVRLLPTILMHTKHYFSTQFSIAEPKPVEKLMITYNSIQALKNKLALFFQQSAIA